MGHITQTVIVRLSSDVENALAALFAAGVLYLLVKTFLIIFREGTK